MQLRSTMLYVKDLERMKRFYGEMLLAKPSDQDSNGVFVAFEMGSVRFALHAIPAEIAKNIEIESPPTLRGENPVNLSSRLRTLNPSERVWNHSESKRCGVLSKNREKPAMWWILRAMSFKLVPLGDALL